MSRAPSTLPFALQPYAGPQQQLFHSQVGEQHQGQSPQSNQRYISNICRAGTMPLSRHTITDPACLIIYILFLLTTIILFTINYFSKPLTTAYTFAQLSLFDKLSNTLSQTLSETMLSCVCLIVVGIVFVLLVIAIPVVIGYLILVSCLGLLIFILYSLIALNWGNVFEKIRGTKKKTYIQFTDDIFMICLIVITAISLILTTFLIVRRLKKLRHLGAMMNVVKVILLKNFPILPITMLFIVSGIQMGLWCGFTRMLWNSVRMSLSSGMPVAPNLVIIFVIILWIWTHGFSLSISDYLCQSWVIHWYYQAKNQQTVSEIGDNDNALKQNWKSLLVKKLFRYHIGTCLHGSVVSAYIPQFIITLIKKYLKKKSNKPPLLQNITYLSRYSYIETIMQSLSFCTASRQTYHLRQRIKQKIPQIYMLGHFLEQIIKIMLPIGTLYLWFIFTYNLDRFLDKTVVDFSPELFFLFCFVITLGIFLQITTNISHLFGIVSDTAVITYSIDCQIERVHYNQNQANSVPPSLKEALIKLQVQIETKPYQSNQNNTEIVKNSMENYPGVLS